MTWENAFWLLVVAGGFVWTVREGLARQRAKKQRAQERAGAVAAGGPVPAELRGDWAERASDRMDAWLDKKLGAWRQRTFGGERVFGDELGHWPVVRHVAPGVLLMKAPYIGPRRMQTFSGWKPPVGTGAAFGALYWFAYQHIATPQALWQNSITVGVIFGLASIPLWKLAHKTRLVIRFDHGAMTWRDPARQKHVVGPEEPRSLQVIIPHRWADEERRIHDNWMRANPGKASPKPLFQTASELVMHTGRGGMQWRTVAEFRNDLSGEAAHRLQNAIDFVTEQAAAELAARTREAADTGPL